MKIRFWQETYLFTLILFLICLNAGILSLTLYTFEKNADAARDTASAEHSYLALSFERDYDDIAPGYVNSVPNLMQTYGKFYRDKGLYLAFFENGNPLFSVLPSAYSPDPDTVTIVKYEGERHVLIASLVCDGKYKLVTLKNVSSLDRELRSLIITYLLTTAAVSLILAVSLYFILRRLSKPLDSLRKTTEQIEAGDFSVTAEEHGNNDFSLLAKSFNSMLAKIREQMDALSVEAERKQMLVDNLAHELRTPLTSIHGYAEYLEKAASSEENRIVAAKYILSESERLQKISEILLDSAFIRGNEIEMTDTELSDILADVKAKLNGKAKERGVVITCNASPMTVKGNPTLLSMLFYNLTDNAIKACNTGGSVSVSCKNGIAVVSDTGKGMTEEQLLHCTEPFYRTDKSRSRAEGGAGLGLALCKQICASHGCDMHFSSKPGVGTKVILTFTG